MEVARFLPRSMSLVGIDIDYSQCPPPPWLPPNVALRHWDIFSRVPEDMIESFDVVILRNLLYLVADPAPLLGNVLKLLSAYNLLHVQRQSSMVRNFSTSVQRLTCVSEPGGHLQWGEWDAAASRIVKAKPTATTIGMEGVWAKNLAYRGITKQPT